MSLQGNYEDIRHFIYQVESGTDFIVIDSVALRQGAEPGSPLTLDLDLSTYYRARARWSLSSSGNSRSSCSRVVLVGTAVWRVRVRAARPRPLLKRLAGVGAASWPAAGADKSRIARRRICRRFKPSVRSRKTAAEIRSGSNRGRRHTSAGAAARRRVRSKARRSATGPIEPPPPPQIPLKFIGLIDGGSGKAGTGGDSQ